MLGFDYFSRREVMFGTGQRKGLWPSAPISICPVGCNSFSVSTGQEENSIKRVCTASVIPQTPQAPEVALDGMTWGQHIRVRGEIWQHVYLWVAGGRALLLNQSPRSALSPDREKDGLILPKSSSWDTSMKNVRLIRTKALCLGIGDWETVVPGHSTTIFFILTNFVFSSGQIDLAKTKQSQVSWGSVLCARWRA